MEAPKETKMVAKDGSHAKMVKIKCLRDIHANGKLHKTGDIVSVSEDEAQEFTKAYKGQYGFSGERASSDKDCHRHTVQRAELVKEA